MIGWLWNNWLLIWLVVCFCLLSVFVCQLSLLCHPLSQNSNQAYGRQPLDSWVKINTEYKFLVATLERGDHITGIGAQKCATVIRERTVGQMGGGEQQRPRESDTYRRWWEHRSYLSSLSSLQQPPSHSLHILFQVISFAKSVPRKKLKIRTRHLSYFQPLSTEAVRSRKTGMCQNSQKRRFLLLLLLLIRAKKDRCYGAIIARLLLLCCQLVLLC